MLSDRAPCVAGDRLMLCVTPMDCKVHRHSTRNGLRAVLPIRVIHLIGMVIFREEQGEKVFLEIGVM